MIEINPNLSIIIKLILLINTIDGKNIDGNSDRESDTLAIRRTKRLLVRNGEDALLTDYPWMAMLIYQQLDAVYGTMRTEPKGGDSICAGSLLNTRYILTAAHCIGEGNTKWKLTAVRLGDYHKRTSVDCGPLNGGIACQNVAVEIAVDRTILHESYRREGNMPYHDIALIKLARTVSYNDYIMPIKLPKTVHVPPSLWVSGWGNDETGQSSATKKKLGVPLFDWSKCQTLWAKITIPLQSDQICAGGLNNGDVCSGDSGGPLMAGRYITEFQEDWTIYGITSFGPEPCGFEGWPSIFTRVYTYVPWIMEKVEKYDPELIRRT